MPKRVEFDGKEHFPMPMRFSLPSDDNVTSDRFGHLDMSDYARVHQLVLDTIEDCQQQGFDCNAIVVRRYTDLSDSYKRTSHVHWGIVEHLDRYHNRGDINNYAPIVVRWFTPEAHEGKQRESFFPDDLHLIHAHMNVTLLRQVFEAQDHD